MDPARRVAVRTGRECEISPRQFCLGHPYGLGFLFGAVKVQGEEPFQELFIVQIGGPAVGGGDGGVEFLVGEVEPGGALVVRVCEGLMSGFYLLGVTAGVEDG